MTAPPTQRPIFAAGPFQLSPASAAPDSWAPIHFNAQRPRKSSNPSTSKNNGKGMLFITATKPADFKKRDVMTKVRKQAMGSYLEKGKRPKKWARKHSDDEASTDHDHSPTSTGSDHQDSIDAFMTRGNTSGLSPSARGDRDSVAPSIQSPASSRTERRTATPDSQVLRMPPMLDAVLPAGPILQSIRVGIKLPYLVFEPPAFQSPVFQSPVSQSIGKPFDPFRSMFQAHHPQVDVEKLKWHCHNFFGTRAMGMYWIPTLVKSPHAFLSTLCIASAHHDSVHSLADESLQTVALRQEVIHMIHRNILNPEKQVDDFNFIALTQLITSEVIAGKEPDLSYHEGGLATMVEVRGGLDKLGVNGRLASTLSWVSLASAVLREARPHSMYTKWCASHSKKTYPNTATIPESPLFVPRDDYQTVERSSRSVPRTMDLLRDIRTMLDLFLQETKHSRQNPLSLKNLYKKILNYPSAAVLQQSHDLTPTDWTYEAIRVASVIQATAIIKRIPLSEALEHAAQFENTGAMYYTLATPDTSESVNPPELYRHDSPVTCFATSPSYATTLAVQKPQAQAQPSNYFPTPTTSTTSRPSFSSASTISTYATSPDTFSFFPPPPPGPPRTPTGPTALLMNLKLALENSDLFHIWSDMAGVLLWLSLVIGAASRKSEKVLRKWYSALTIRCCIMLCFEHPEGIHATLVRMGEVVEGLRVQGGGGGGGEKVVGLEIRMEGGGGKRRRQ